jgi:hypothetical protein
MKTETKENPITNLNCAIRKKSEQRACGVAWTLATKKTHSSQLMSATSSTVPLSQSKNLEKSFLSMLHQDHAEQIKTGPENSGTNLNNLPLKLQGEKKNEEYSFSISSLGGAIVNTKNISGEMLITIEFKKRNEVPSNLTAFCNLIERQLEIKFSVPIKVEVKIL